MGAIVGAAVRYAEGAVKWLPILYLVWALPLAMTVAILTPPFQNPDEANHMLRAVQIERGGLISYRFTTPEKPNHLQAGGASAAGVSNADALFADLPGWRNAKATADKFTRAGRIVFGPSVPSWFPNTALYPPFFYIPAAIGIGFAELFGLGVLDGLYAARLADVFAAALLTAVALALAKRARPALAIIAMFPMTIALYAALTQDALLIALALLAVALIDRVVAENRAATSHEIGAIAVLIALVSLARPPYIVLALMLPAMANGGARREWMASVAIMALIAIWFAYLAAFVVIDFGPGKPAAQLQYIVANPERVFSIALKTLRIMPKPLGREMVGDFGYLDTPLPHWFWDASGLAAIAGFAGATLGHARRPWVIAGTVILSCIALSGASYIQWASPSASYVTGLQGRYFTPLLAFFALALPATPLGMRQALSCVSVAAIAFLGLLAPAIMLWALVSRFYLAS